MKKKVKIVRNKPHTIIKLHDKNIELTLSKRAQRALTQRKQPLLVQMELYFSCLIKKQLSFPETLSDDAIVIDASPNLRISFRPICTAQCSIADAKGTVPTMTMPVKNPRAYVPRWLYLDYRKQQWQGEFGYILE